MNGWMVGWLDGVKRVRENRWTNGVMETYISRCQSIETKKFSFLFKVNRMRYVNAEDRNNEEEKEKKIMALIFFLREHSEMVMCERFFLSL